MKAIELFCFKLSSFVEGCLSITWTADTHAPVVVEVITPLVPYTFVIAVPIPDGFQSIFSGCAVTRLH